MRAIGQWFRLESVFRRTISPFWKFLRFLLHDFRSCSVWMNSLRHLTQNLFNICYVLLQRLWQYVSTDLKLPSGGITTFDFIVCKLKEIVEHERHWLLQVTLVVSWQLLWLLSARFVVLYCSNLFRVFSEVHSGCFLLF